MALPEPPKGINNNILNMKPPNARRKAKPKKTEQPVVVQRRPDQPPSEVDIIHVRISQVTDETLDSTRRMLQLCDEAKEAAIQTLVFLDDQGEQLDRIEERMHSMNEDIREAEKNIDGLEKCCGLCVLPWKKARRKSAENATWRAEQDHAALGDGPRIIVQEGEMGRSRGMVPHITNDAREDEMDKNLNDVAGMISNLRNMAIDMGNEYTVQNQKLDRIIDKARHNDARIQAANSRTDKLMKAK